jgi:hypothetical protein
MQTDWDPMTYTYISCNTYANQNCLLLLSEIYSSILLCWTVLIYPFVYVHSGMAPLKNLLDLFGPRITVFTKVFVHLVYNSALFLVPCCCSFFLNVVANFCVAWLFNLEVPIHTASNKFDKSKPVQ